jgi:hypothetical protein
MKSAVTAAVAALLIGGMSLGALGSALAEGPAPDANAPAAAQPSAPAPNVGPGQWQQGHRRTGWAGHQRPGGMGAMGIGRGGLLALACGDRGAEALEIGFVHLYYRVKPTDTQQPLFDALKTAALADQKTFAKSCADATDKARGQQQSPLDRLENRLAFEQARVAALSDIVPKFKAFYESLTPDQQARLQRPQQRRGMRGMHQPGAPGNGPMQHRQGPMRPWGEDLQPGAATPSADPASGST